MKATLCMRLLHKHAEHSTTCRLSMSTHRCIPNTAQCLALHHSMMKGYGYVTQLVRTQSTALQGQSAPKPRFGATSDHVLETFVCAYLQPGASALPNVCGLHSHSTCGSFTYPREEMCCPIAITLKVCALNNDRGCIDPDTAVS